MKILLKTFICMLVLSTVVHAKKISGTGSIEFAPSHPRNGKDIVDRELLPVPLDTPAEPLQGMTYRANNNRNGDFKTSGVPVMKQRRWTFKIEQDSRAGMRITSSPLVVDGICYVGSHNGIFYAIDMETGEEKWRYDSMATIYSSSTYYKGIVYFGAFDRLLALDAKTGALIWHIGQKKKTLATFPKETVATGAGESWDGIPSVGVAYGYVFSQLGGRIRAYDLKTGKEVWKNIKGGRVMQLASFTLANGSIYMGNQHTRFYRYSLIKCEPLLSYVEIGNDTQQSTGAIVGDKMYRAGIFGNIYCGDTKTESKNRATRYFMSLIGSSKGRNNAANKKGQVGRWQSFTSVGVSDGIATFGTVGGYLSGFDTESGKERWLTDMGKENGFLCPPSFIYPNSRFFTSKLNGDFRTFFSLTPYSVGLIALQYCMIAE